MAAPDQRSLHPYDATGAATSFKLDAHGGFCLTPHAHQACAKLVVKARNRWAVDGLARRLFRRPKRFRMRSTVWSMVRSCAGECTREFDHRTPDDVRGFEQTPLRVAPATGGNEPVLAHESQQFGIHLTHNPLWVCRPPLINSAMTLPQLEKQFNLPAHARENKGYWGAVCGAAAEVP
jgi:hypothetical protein